MVTAAEFDHLAQSLDGVVSKPHFDRRAYAVKRNFATLAGDGASANLLFTPDEQDMRCALHPGVLTPVPNKWGERGWTTLRLEGADAELTLALLQAARAHAG